jgi:hypothetical protein
VVLDRTSQSSSPGRRRHRYRYRLRRRLHHQWRRHRLLATPPTRNWPRLNTSGCVIWLFFMDAIFEGRPCLRSRTSSIFDDFRMTESAGRLRSGRALPTSHSRFCDTMVAKPAPLTWGCSARPYLYLFVLACSTSLAAVRIGMSRSYLGFCDRGSI